MRICSGYAASPPPLVFLDEPTIGLDMISKDAIRTFKLLDILPVQDININSISIEEVIRQIYEQ